ncbi:MAG TPA: hypothetical protein VI874_04450 [Candidatus Norongarragalinales archaeon]|nr:hypothetical protein [Candidatus Norongarragalinales archaeon]
MEPLAFDERLQLLDVTSPQDRVKTTRALLRLALPEDMRHKVELAVMERLKSESDVDVREALIDVLGCHGKSEKAIDFAKNLLQAESHPKLRAAAELAHGKISARLRPFIR